jgi:2,4-dienoyl-CoA reductase-like NADH-dependent reductase (Old Yellow Enzyme family)
VDDFLRVYDSMLSSGTKTFRNYLLLRNNLTSQVFESRWKKAAGDVFEGVNLGDCTAIKQAVSIPVICTGGFQTASIVRRAIEEGRCDAVSIARPLIANNDLVEQWARGADSPEKPCTYCNKCLVNTIENPLGCYDVTRFDGNREEMIAQILSVFDPPPFRASSIQIGNSMP